VTVGVLALLLAGCGSNETGEPAASEEASQQPVPVTATEAKVETLRPAAELVGVLAAAPERTAYVAAQVSGQVARVAVLEGQSVRAGEPLIVLDDRTAVAERDQAKANVAEAEASLALLQRGPLPQEIESARQDEQTAAAAEEGLKAKLKALEPLRAKGEISPVQFEQAQTALKAASAARAGAEAKLNLVQSGSRAESVAEGKARAEAAKAALSAKELAVTLCVLTSPIDGVVTTLDARQGMSVQPSDRLATVMDLSTMYAQFRVPVNLVAKAAEGAAVRVSFEAAGLPEQQGTPLRVGKVADPQTGDVEAFASLPNAEGMLKPGLGCRVELGLPEVANAVVLPASAVADHDGTPVVTLIRDGKAFETAVEVGARTADSVQIVKGVAAGDRVALEGGYGLPEGCPVVVKGDGK
jgi:HlyD family secretion protein